MVEHEREVWWEGDHEDHERWAGASGTSPRPPSTGRRIHPGHSRSCLYMAAEVVVDFRPISHRCRRRFPPKHRPCGFRPSRRQQGGHPSCSNRSTPCRRRSAAAPSSVSSRAGPSTAVTLMTCGPPAHGRRARVRLDAMIRAVSEGRPHSWGAGWRTPEATAKLSESVDYCWRFLVGEAEAQKAARKLVAILEAEGVPYAII